MASGGYDTRVRNRTRVWIGVQMVVAAAFLAAVWQYREPGAGFTSFIEFPGTTHDDELPAIRDVPHYHHQDSGGYDGQFYAQLAVDPLLRDSAIDRAMDNPQYRARRMLLSWTAYAAGGGDPARVLQIYALQNVVVWLLLAWLLCRWMPPATGRHVALWAGCLLSHGLLSSVRYALPDGPGALLIAAAVAVAGASPVMGGRGSPSGSALRAIAAALVVGVAGLARETAVLAGAMFLRLVRRSPRTWIVAGLCGFLCLVPLALWMDYLRSIYRTLSIAGADHLTTPFSGLTWKVRHLVDEASSAGLTYPLLASTAALAGFLVQAVIAGRELVRSSGRSPWALVGVAFVVLAIVTHRDVFAGAPGAFTRVFLPVTLAANALLAARPRPAWWLIAAANLGVIPGVMLLWFRY
jgi:hypothetical protein